LVGAVFAQENPPSTQILRLAARIAIFAMHNYLNGWILATLRKSDGLSGFAIANGCKLDGYSFPQFIA
jgi:hypothetical protein